MSEVYEPQGGRFIADDGNNSLTDWQKDVHNKFKTVNNIFVAIVIVLVVAVVTMLISVLSMIIDSSRFNSTIYKEYSSKLEGNQLLLESNKELLKQNIELNSMLKKYIMASSSVTE